MISLFRIAIVSTCLLLSGCDTDLYTNLSERDANQMLAILTTNGVVTHKKYNGDAGVTIVVDEKDLARAITILARNGLPREERETLGKVFQKSGIMSSPFEEHVRYMYALAEEVSTTLNDVDGVLVARVHVVIPQSSDYEEVATPASAAVFIKYRPGVDLDFLTPQIRRLVSNSIEGVKYEDVTVVLVAAEAPQMLGSPSLTPIVELFNGLGVRASDVQAFWRSITMVIVLFVCLVLSNLATAFFYRRARLALKRIDGEGDLQIRARG